MSDIDEPRSELAGQIGRWLGLTVLVVILLLPTPSGLEPAGQRLAGVVALMAIWWVTQAIPISATSLLPLALFPILGIQSAKDVGKAYLNDSSFLYLGGFIIALGIERWGLHRRIALLTVAAVGCSPRRIVLGFLLATFGLSMWMSNTATTLLMLPIATALIATLEKLRTSADHAHNPSGDSTELAAPDRHFSHFGMALTLGIAYAASIGGLATLVGTPTNIAFVNIYKAEFPDAPVISAGQWIMTWTPFGLVFLLFTWLLLVWGMGVPAGFENLNRSFFVTRLRELGRVRLGEAIMLVLFIVTALLWIFRTDFKFAEPVLVPGWNRIPAMWLRSWGVQEKEVLDYITDATVAMTVALLMFLIPIERKSTGEWKFLMDWEAASRLPWEILLLFGGGFAMANAFESTKLSIWIGDAFSRVAGGQPVWVLVLTVCALLTFLTEFTSNVATVNAVLPIIAAACVAMKIDPRLLMIPATISASCGFMMPIGTPPNAIVYGTGRIRMSQMARYGLIMDIAGVVLATLATLWLMVPQLQIAVQ